MDGPGSEMVSAVHAEGLSIACERVFALDIDWVDLALQIVV